MIDDADDDNDGGYNHRKIVVFAHVVTV